MKYSSKTLKQYTFINPYNKTVTLTLTIEEYQTIEPYITPLKPQ